MSTFRSGTVLAADQAIPGARKTQSRSDPPQDEFRPSRDMLFFNNAVDSSRSILLRGTFQNVEKRL
jgi:hypothetical protein